MWVWVLMVVVPSAWAQRPPETHPVSSSQNIAMSWDRSAPPGDIEVFPHQTLLGYSSDESLKYGQLHLTCSSESDATKGACPTEGTDNAGTFPGTVVLEAKESRSGLTTKFSARAWLSRAMYTQACGSYWLTVTRPLNTAIGDLCAGYWSVGTGASLIIPAHELERLVAGQWTATLVLRLHAEQKGAPIADYTFNFDFTITDHNAVSIYFPAFPNVSPLVALNAGYDPISRTIGGRTGLDMCLYDGLGSQAQYLGVTVRDTGTRPPGPSGFSLWHDTAGNDDSQRLDYTVTLDHNGTTVPLTNGVEEQLHGIDTAQLRLVMLPGMSQPVFCVPTPMTLDIPRVPISTKRSGIYWGDLKVELRVPTATP